MQHISDYINLFIADRKIYCEDVTVQSYIFYLTRFKRWLNDDDFSSLTKQTLKNYILFLRNTMKNTSVRTNYRPVKAFCITFSLLIITGSLWPVKNHCLFFNCETFYKYIVYKKSQKNALEILICYISASLPVYAMGKQNRKTKAEACST